MKPTDGVIKIKPPQAPKLDDQPLGNIDNKGLGDGMNLLEAIYKLFTTKEPVGFCTIKKYRDVLNLEIRRPNLFKILLIPFVILDWLQSLVVLVSLFAVLFLLVFTLAKFVGFTDWIDLRVSSPTKVEYAIPKDINVHLK